MNSAHSPVDQAHCKAAEFNVKLLGGRTADGGNEGPWAQGFVGTAENLDWRILRPNNVRLSTFRFKMFEDPRLTEAPGLKALKPKSWSATDESVM